MPCLGDLVGHGHFPPSSCWSKTRNPHSLLLTKPPAGIWGGDREDQGSIWSQRFSPAPQPSPKLPLFMSLAGRYHLIGAQRVVWGWGLAGWISLFPSRWSMGMPKAWQQFGPHEDSPQPLVGQRGSAPCPPRHARRRSRLPALSHAHWSFTKQTPQRPPPFLGDASPPIPLNRSLSQQPNKIPVASSWLELPPPSQLRGRSMAAASTC